MDMLGMTALICATVLVGIKMVLGYRLKRAGKWKDKK